MRRSLCPKFGFYSSDIWHVYSPFNGNVDLAGLFSNHGPLYFVGAKRFFSKMGLACHIAKIHSEVINDRLVQGLY